MEIRNGKVSSMWIEPDQSRIGLVVVVCPSALSYTVLEVHDSIESCTYHHLGEVLQVDIDNGNIIRQ